jgi:acetoin utilization deacetylase AcuC-like enzyme
MSLSIYSSRRYRVDWPGHVFPTQKYDDVRERLRAERPEIFRLVREPVPATRLELETVHPAGYLERIDRLSATPELAYREFEIPISPSVVECIRHQTGGSIQAARDAVDQRGASVNLGGGFHHAFADRGEGFCFFNDVAVAIRVVKAEGRIERAAVIDCDLHQGNGTAHIFRDDASVFTFSIHQENNFPIKRKSDLDIGLEDFAGDDRYLEELARAVPAVLDRHRPDLVVYLAGADPYEEDQLGSLRLTRAGLRERDRIVFAECRERGISLAVLLAGGYAVRMEDVTAIHFQMVCDLFDAYQD